MKSFLQPQQGCGAWTLLLCLYHCLKLYNCGTKAQGKADSGECGCMAEMPSAAWEQLYMFSLEGESYHSQTSEQAAEGTGTDSSSQCKTDGQGQTAAAGGGHRTPKSALSTKHKPTLNAADNDQMGGWQQGRHTAGEGWPR